MYLKAYHALVIKVKNVFFLGLTKRKLHEELLESVVLLGDPLSTEADDIGSETPKLYRSHPYENA